MGITEERIECIEKQVKVMESFGSAAVDISSELDAIIQHNYRMKQLIERLLETNDRLRKRSDGDKCLNMPVDRFGGVIHVDDAVYFEDGIETVLGLRWNGACWEIGLLGFPEYKAPEDCVVVPKSLLSGADGVPIALGDTVYCDDDPEPLKVVSLHAGNASYCTVGVEDSAGIRYAVDAPRLSHEKPKPADSWARLEADAKKQSCSYFNCDLPPVLCDDCPHGSMQTGRACWWNARLDIISRAKKLAGIEEEARND